jgi:hypothetical protein
MMHKEKICRLTLKKNIEATCYNKVIPALMDVVAHYKICVYEKYRC